MISGLHKTRVNRARYNASMLVLMGLLGLSTSWAQQDKEGAKVQCANLVYAVNKTSVCFSDRFLQRLELETNVRTESKFVRVQLDSSDLYRYPFSIMTGEGAFSLTPKERMQLKYYVTHGGFLLASSGCSDPGWTRSFRNEMAQIFPNQKLTAVPLNHPIYRTVYAVKAVETTHARHKAQLEAITQNGAIVVIFSPDGLNDTSHAQNCCCCGGDEVGQAEYINVNILSYALFH
jgi:hypothetical protein